MTREAPISVLVIDDSAANRRAITHILEAAPGIKVVDRAADGEEGLKKALKLKPDVITLDLEMPRLDGYSFLRLLMAQAPTPVVVLSSYAHPSDVFKAMQLGAVDFVAKPDKGQGASLNSVRAELVEKVRAVRDVRPELSRKKTPAVPMPAVELKPSLERDAVIVAVAASTGGPPAVQLVLESLAGLPVCVLVAQHMPPRFTEAFAARLDSTVNLRVTEAKRGDPLDPGRAYIGPGGQQLEVAVRGGKLVVEVKASSEEDRYSPSADRLFSSVAKVAGARAVGVVLTGMGNDGAEGVRALADAGAEIWAESEETAVVYGMPEAAVATGRVKHVLPLAALGQQLARTLARARDGGRLPPRK